VPKPFACNPPVALCTNEINAIANCVKLLWRWEESGVEALEMTPGCGIVDSYHFDYYAANTPDTCNIRLIFNLFLLVRAEKKKNCGETLVPMGRVADGYRRAGGA